MKQTPTAIPISRAQPDAAAPAGVWVDWYFSQFLPDWAERARDPAGPGFFDLLDLNGDPPQRPQKSVLAQARLLFTFSHLAMMTGNRAHVAAARVARDALPYFRKESGLYCRVVHRDGQPGGEATDRIATSYDQSFVLLGLATWGRLTATLGDAPEDTGPELESCWSAIEAGLTDPATGMLLEHDALDDPASPDAPPRAQNPHMHLYEAALQVFEMTGKVIWRERAEAMRAKGLEYFFDSGSGTIIEFIAPDLTPLPGREGQRREIGHQCEWAWLLMRESDLGGDPAMRVVAQRLLGFADSFGFAPGGVMQGAAYDAVSADTGWREERFLLWPQTEAIKAHAVRAGTGDHAERACALVRLVFQRYFAGRAVFVNQLDAQGQVLWGDALSRLHYHLALALTEGARAGLWPVGSHPNP